MNSFCRNERHFLTYPLCPGGAHLLSFMNPDQVNEHLIPFLESQAQKHCSLPFVPSDFSLALSRIAEMEGDVSINLRDPLASISYSRVPKDDPMRLGMFELAKSLESRSFCLVGVNTPEEWEVTDKDKLFWK